MSCVLCKYRYVSVLDKIKSGDLVRLYRKFLNVDFSYLIKQDFIYYECQNCKLRYYDPPITGDEKFYQELQKFGWYYMDSKKEFEIAKLHINEQDRILEIGSGKGAFLRDLSYI